LSYGKQAGVAEKLCANAEVAREQKYGDKMQIAVGLEKFSHKLL
jgi:hypothetical protein